MTKPITSVALMLLVERGLLHLDARCPSSSRASRSCHCLVPGATDISQVEPCAPPTLHQLLTHTSGLSYPFNPGLLPAGDGRAEASCSARAAARWPTMADQVAALPLAFAPGTRWEYSVGIDVLGRVIEVVSGKPLEQFLEAEIFGPLGMDETPLSRAAEGTRPFRLALHAAGRQCRWTLNAAKPGDETLRLTDRRREIAVP